MIKMRFDFLKTFLGDFQTLRYVSSILLMQAKDKRQFRKLEVELNTIDTKAKLCSRTEDFSS